MQPTYARQTRLAPAPTASSALLVDAEYARRAAARSHQMISGSRISASRVSIDACQISRLIDSLIVDFELEGSRSRAGLRAGRRIYDTIGADRRQRWRQLYYRSALRAEGFVVRTVRVPRRPGKPGTVASDRDQSNGVESALAGDLVRLARELTTVLLLVGGEARPAMNDRPCAAPRPTKGRPFAAARTPIAPPFEALRLMGGEAVLWSDVGRCARPRRSARRCGTACRGLRADLRGCARPGHRRSGHCRPSRSLAGSVARARAGRPLTVACRPRRAGARHDGRASLPQLFHGAWRW